MGTVWILIKAKFSRLNKDQGPPLMVTLKVLGLDDQYDLDENLSLQVNRDEMIT